MEECLIINSETVLTPYLKPATVQIFNRGQIRFSVGAIQELGLEVGDKIEFILPTMGSKTIYFRKSEKGFTLHTELTKGGLTRLRVHSRPLVRKLLMFFETEKSKTYDITNEKLEFNGTKCWYIGKENIHKPVKWRTKIYE